MSDVFKHLGKRKNVCTGELKNDCLNLLMGRCMDAQSG